MRAEDRRGAPASLGEDQHRHGGAEGVGKGDDDGVETDAVAAHIRADRAEHGSCAGNEDEPQ